MFYNRHPTWNALWPLWPLSEGQEAGLTEEEIHGGIKQEMWELKGQNPLSVVKKCQLNKS